MPNIPFSTKQLLYNKGKHEPLTPAEQTEWNEILFWVKHGHKASNAYIAANGPIADVRKAWERFQVEVLNHNNPSMSLYLHYKPAKLKWPKFIMSIYFTWLAAKKASSVIHLDKNNTTYCVLYFYDSPQIKRLNLPTWVKIYQVSGSYYRKLTTITSPRLNSSSDNTQWLVDLISKEVEHANKTTHI